MNAQVDATAAARTKVKVTPVAKKVSKSSSLTVLTINQMERLDDSSVFVTNMTKPKGNVNFSVSDGTSKRIAVKVPCTFIPIDLTTQATKTSIITSPDFRALVTKGYLRVVDPEEARAFIDSSPEATEEHRRLFRQIEVAAIGGNPETSRVEIESETVLGTINVVAKNVIESEMEENDALRILRNNAGDLTAEDWEYVASKSDKAKVKEFAASMAMNPQA